MRHKKGISPLVSTILLIGFASLLGLVVMGWGSTTIDSLPADCSSVSLAVTQIDNSLIVVPKLDTIVCKDQKLEVLKSLT